MTIEDLVKKYELTENDFWKHRSGISIIKHDACERIAKIEGIIFEYPEVHFALSSIVMIGKATYGKKTEWSTGEASDINVKMKGQYYWSMAEKRLKDRLTLKLIGAYEHGIYSDVEADDFRKNNNNVEFEFFNHFDYCDKSIKELREFYKSLDKNHPQRKEIADFAKQKQEVENNENR